MDENEISHILFTKAAMGKIIKKFIKFLPTIEVEYTIKPIA